MGDRRERERSQVAVQSSNPLVPVSDPFVVIVSQVTVKFVHTNGILGLLGLQAQYVWDSRIAIHTFIHSR